MTLYKRRNSVFNRIGDQYGSFIDPDHFLGRSPFEDSWMAGPPVNIQEAKDHYNLEIGLPGYSKDDIQISVSDDLLEVEAERDVSEEQTKGDYIHKEIDTMSVKKAFRLPSAIDAEQIESTYENGLLKIRLPLPKEDAGIKNVVVS